MDRVREAIQCGGADVDGRGVRVAVLTSQATAVVTGLAALLLQLGRRIGFDWGANVGHALGEILRAAALRLAEGGPEDFGYGALLWPNIVATVSDCATSPVRRNNVLFGSQLHLEG